jgi:hypothetical protein
MVASLMSLLPNTLGGCATRQSRSAGTSYTLSAFVARHRNCTHAVGGGVFRGYDEFTLSERGQGD